MGAEGSAEVLKNKNFLLRQHAHTYLDTATHAVTLTHAVENLFTNMTQGFLVTDFCVAMVMTY